MKTPKKTVLVIDDSEHSFILVERYLQEDYRCIWLEKFIELPSTLRNDSPDLIFLDLNMPGLNGETMAKMIRRYQPTDIPIIIYSSDTKQRLRRVCREIEAAAYLGKDCTIEAMQRLVEQVFAKSQLRFKAF